MSLRISLFVALCLLVTCGLSSGERVRYDNYRVYKVTASSKAELATLKDMDGSSDSLMFLDGVHSVGKHVNIVVAPHKVPDFLKIMGQNEIDYELVEQNLQNALEADEGEVATRSSAYDWTSYHELDDTYTWLQSLAREYVGIVTLIEGGKTYEGRSILGVKISYKANRPGIFLEAGIHAREWIGPATATYIINQLLTSQDPAVKNIAQNHDWYIFPHTNPDGFVYTHTTDRMWRKTRSPNGNCFGADPNRNWGVHWNEVGTSNNPCSDTYAGKAAFSEIETRSLSEYIKSLGNKINLYLSFHAYSQYLLYPYGYSSQLPKNVGDLKKVFDTTIAALAKRYGTKYTGGNIYDAIYPAAGSSVDWAYDAAGIKMSFCYELRPSSKSVSTGFKLPPTSIIPTGEETLDSVVAMIGEVKNLGYF